MRSCLVAATTNSRMLAPPPNSVLATRAQLSWSCDDSDERIIAIFAHLATHAQLSWSCDRGTPGRYEKHTKLARHAQLSWSCDDALGPGSVRAGAARDACTAVLELRQGQHGAGASVRNDLATHAQLSWSCDRGTPPPNKIGSRLATHAQLSWSCDTKGWWPRPPAFGLSRRSVPRKAPEPQSTVLGDEKVRS